MLSEKKKSPNHKLYGSIFITFLKWHDYRIREQMSGCQGLRWCKWEGSRCSYKSATRGTFMDGNILCVDSVNVNVLVVILYYVFARCDYWGEAVWGIHEISLWRDLKTTCESTMILKLKVKKIESKWVKNIYKELIYEWHGIKCK